MLVEVGDRPHGEILVGDGGAGGQELDRAGRRLDLEIAVLRVRLEVVEAAQPAAGDARRIEPSITVSRS
ncbi:MAG: hypothetical protein R3D25_18235 [Geminicoccaceae bacterium]